MEVWATKRTPTISTSEPVDVLLPATEIRRLLATSDYVVIAASLNSSTRDLIGRAELQGLKRGAVLVNVARGAIVDKVALAEALLSGQLRGAVLDVTDPEPLPPDDPLWHAPNLWITPHISGETTDGYDRAVDLFCANLKLYLAGDPERMGNIADLSAHR